MQLAGFTRVHLEPNEAREVSFLIGQAQLRMLDRDMHWIVEPGRFRIMVGASSKDIRQVAELEVR
jgi:beta-glucosidase